MANPKPFHEAIVEHVKRIGLREHGENFALHALATLTAECVIPRNHDAIAEAFKEKYRMLNENPTYLFQHLASEKARAEKKAAEKAKEAKQAKPAQPTEKPVEIGTGRSYEGYRTAKKTAKETRYEKGDILV